MNNCGGKAAPCILMIFRYAQKDVEIAKKLVDIGNLLELQFFIRA